MEKDFEVRYVHRNILSVSENVDAGCTMVFSKKEAYVERRGYRMDLKRKLGVFVLPVEVICPLVGQPSMEGQADETTVQAASAPTEETRAPRIKPTPKKPSHTEIMQHMAAHVPFRTWCKHCVAGRARDHAHRRTNTESEFPIVSMDYAFLGREDEQMLATMLVMHEQPSGADAAIQVAEKGASDYAVAAVMHYLNWWGHAKIIIRTDGEPAIVSLVRKLKEVRPHGTIHETSAKASHASNAHAENTVDRIGGLVRTIRSRLEEVLKIRIGATSTLLPWIIRHAGF
jgi:hypothetical protein